MAVAAPIQVESATPVIGLSAILEAKYGVPTLVEMPPRRHLPTEASRGPDAIVLQDRLG